MSTLFYYTQPVNSGDAWRQGALIIAADGAVLPMRCIRCGCEADLLRKTKRFTWYPQWTVIVMLFALLIGAILALCLQKRASLTFFLCKKHDRRRFIAILASLGAVTAGLLVLILAIATGSGPAGACGGILLFATALYAAAAIPILRISGYHNGRATFRGASKAFLLSLENQGTLLSAPPAAGNRGT